MRIVSQWPLGIASVALWMSLSTGIAFADGMPFKEMKAQPILTPLDKALDEIQNQETPVELKKEVEAPAAIKVAEEPKPEPAPAPVPMTRVVEVQPNTSFFGLSVGMYDPFTHGEKAASLTLEFQPGLKIAGVLQPLFGALVTTQGSLMGYGGVGVPINLSEKVFLMPSVSAGAYEAGDGADLGRGKLAFRFGTELGYILANDARVGINAHIISNGFSLDREDRTEVIGLSYTMPLHALSGSSAVNLPSNKEQAAPPAP